LLIAVPETAGQVLGVAQKWLTRTFGWYYMLVICGYLLFVVGLAFSDYGKLKLGGKDDSRTSATAPGPACCSRPVSVFRCCTSARPSRWTTTSTRRKAPGQPRGRAPGPAADLPALGPARLGDLRPGRPGRGLLRLPPQPAAGAAFGAVPAGGRALGQGRGRHAVDIFGMFVTLLGLVTNLGIGSMQVSSGLEYLFGMDHSKTNLLVVILVMAGVATIAAVSGVENGIRRLSNLNIVLFSGLLIFVLLGGEPCTCSTASCRTSATTSTASC
jgi:choline/glycine/proline betaine transport protein